MCVFVSPCLFASVSLSHCPHPPSWSSFLSCYSNHNHNLFKIVINMFFMTIFPFIFIPIFIFLILFLFTFSFTFLFLFLILFLNYFFYQIEGGGAECHHYSTHTEQSKRINLFPLLSSLFLFLLLSSFLYSVLFLICSLFFLFNIILFLDFPLCQILYLG